MCKIRVKFQEILISGLVCILYVCWCSAGEAVPPADDDEVWEAGGSGGSADTVGEQDAGGAQAGKTPQRSCIRQGNPTVGCTLTCVCVCA